MSKTLGVSPLLILICMLLASTLMGIFGIVFAVPFSAIISIIFAIPSSATKKTPSLREKLHNSQGE